MELMILDEMQLSRWATETFAEAAQTYIGDRLQIRLSLSMNHRGDIRVTATPPGTTAKQVLYEGTDACMATDIFNGAQQMKPSIPVLSADSFPKPIEHAGIDVIILDNGQPTSCPRCGARTELEDVDNDPEVHQAHNCPGCGYRFVGVFEDE